MNDQPKPAAALTATRIKRGMLSVGIAEQPTPNAPPKSERSFELPFPDLERTGGFLTWRRAGLFGLVYVGALAAFASAFDVWSMLGL